MILVMLLQELSREPILSHLELSENWIEIESKEIWNSSRKFRENTFDENDAFHQKLRNIISKQNHCKINMKSLCGAIHQCTAIDLSFGSVNSIGYRSKWNTLRHPSSPHAISTCNHKQFKSSKHYIRKLLSCVSALCTNMNYDARIHLLKPMTFCHHCCIEILHRLKQVLKIINFGSKNIIITSTFQVDSSNHPFYQDIPSFVYPIELIIDIIRNILSFPNAAKYIFKYRPKVWKSILKFWEIVCLSYATYGDLCYVNPNIMTDIRNTSRRNIADIMANVDHDGSRKRLSRDVVLAFTASILNTVGLWKQDEHWKYLLRTKHWNLVQFVALYCSKTFDLYKIDLVNMWEKKCFTDCGLSKNAFYDNHDTIDEHDGEIQRKAKFIMLFLEELPKMWDVVAVAVYFNKKRKTKQNIGDVIYQEIDKHSKYMRDTHVNQSKHSVVKTKLYIAEIADILKGLFFTLIHEKSERRKAARLRRKKSLDAMRERICANGKCNQRQMSQMMRHRLPNSANQINQSRPKFKKCDQCHLVYYCCRKCQKYDWKYKHKLYCKVFADQKQ
eukprot:239230_1